MSSIKDTFIVRFPD